MQIWDNTLADVVGDCKFIEMSDMLPEDDRFMFVKFDLGNGVINF